MSTFRAYGSSTLGTPVDLNERVAALEAEVRVLNTTLSQIVGRLLDGVVPQVVHQPDAQPSDHPESPADDSDWGGAMDWTDLFIGIDRPRDYREAGHLAPGESVPYVPAPTTPGTTVGDTDAVTRWRQLGQEAFDEWNDQPAYPERAQPMIPPLEV